MGANRESHNVFSSISASVIALSAPRRERDSGALLQFAAASALRFWSTFADDSDAREMWTLAEDRHYNSIEMSASRLATSKVPNTRPDTPFLALNKPMLPHSALRPIHDGAHEVASKQRARARLRHLQR